MDHEKVSKAVENICNLGCSTVSNVIETLEANLPVTEASHLDATERNALLNELKDIMQVYDQD